ncbi:DUF6777 domain-containing protein [Streptomyces yangpuensis]|uniref:DUF6777 domain-containing protein n=1 Tax=Streptomyces yangpuensis TaxID=1648182 RepID=UPI00366A2B79
MKHPQVIRRRAVALAAILVGLAVITTGCAKIASQGAKVAVRAVARGVPTAAPFFEAALNLGTDAPVGKTLALEGGAKKGNQPGLYGGSRNSKSCDKNKLVRFLKDPGNRQKAVQWAKTLDIDADRIEAFVEKLTPVVLRNDTLVKNHDYEEGEAVGFDALLEAGIAVLVDTYGKPVVQCSCGNPLRTFEHDVDSADVTFDGNGRGNGKKWKAYDPRKVVKVEPVAEKQPVTTYELVDIEEKDAGLERRAGTDGAQDEALPEDPGDGKDPSTRKPEVRVPAVKGRSAQEATQILEDQGLRVRANDGASGNAAPGTVLGQDPAADEQVAPGTTVTLTLAPGPSPSGTVSSSPPPVSSPPTDDPGTTLLTALANAAVRKSPSSTSPKVSSVAVGGQYPAACYRYGETTDGHGSTGGIWVQLRLKSGGLGWVTGTALQEAPTAAGLRQC